MRDDLVPFEDSVETAKIEQPRTQRQKEEHIDGMVVRYCGIFVLVLCAIIIVALVLKFLLWLF